MNAVVTVAIGDQSLALARITTPIMRRYASQCNCAFVVITDDKVKAGHPKFEKFQLFDLLETYERIIYLDVDTLVMPSCPNLLECVSPRHFGAYFDSNGGNGDADIPGRLREEEMACFQTALGDVGWKKDYFNSGVMVVSRAHREMFSYAERIACLGRFIDQTHLNYRLKKIGFAWFDIGQKFNHFAALSRSRRLLETRFSSFIIHYAGYSEFYPEGSLMEQVCNDVQHVYGLS